MIFCITYEFKNSEKNYSDFFLEMKNLGEANQFMNNCWFLSSETTNNDIYESLKKHLDGPDLLFITSINLNTTSGWLPSTSVEWLRDLNR